MGTKLKMDWAQYLYGQTDKMPDMWDKPKVKVPMGYTVVARDRNTAKHSHIDPYDLIYLSHGYRPLNLNDDQADIEDARYGDR